MLCSGSKLSEDKPHSPGGAGGKGSLALVAQPPLLSTAVASGSFSQRGLSLPESLKSPTTEAFWPFPVQEWIKKLFLISKLNLPNCSSWPGLLAVSPGFTRECSPPTLLLPQ